MVDARCRMRAAGSFAAAALLGSLAGCAATATPPMRAQSVVLSSAQAQELAQQTAPYRTPGTGVINGQVTLDTTRGRIIAGDGTPVTLIPATGYARAQFRQYAVERDQLLPEPVSANGGAGDQVTWSTKTDAYGHFSFSGLPAGDYLLTSPVSWNELGPASLLVTDVAYATVHLEAGETAQATVTRKVMIELETSFDEQMHSAHRPA